MSKQYKRVWKSFSSRVNPLSHGRWWRLAATMPTTTTACSVAPSRLRRRAQGHCSKDEIHAILCYATIRDVRQNHSPLSGGTRACATAAQSSCVRSLQRRAARQAGPALAGARAPAGGGRAGAGRLGAASTAGGPLLRRSSVNRSLTVRTSLDDVGDKDLDHTRQDGREVVRHMLVVHVAIELAGSALCTVARNPPA